MKDKKAELTKRIYNLIENDYEELPYQDKIDVLDSIKEKCKEVEKQNVKQEETKNSK